MTQWTDSHRMHGRRAIEALWQASRRLRRKTVLAAILASIFGLSLVSMLLELRGRNGALMIVAAVLLVLLLVKPVLMLDRLLRRRGSVAAPVSDGSAAGDATHSIQPQAPSGPSKVAPTNNVSTHHRRTEP